MNVGYATNSASVALAAGTARSVIGVRAGAAFGLNLKGYDISFDGVTSSAVPVYVELCYATFATNPPGTNSTTVAPTQRYGRVLAHGMTAAHSWVAANEPTVLTMIQDFWLDPNKGLVIYDYPLGLEPDTALNEGFVIRCTAPAVVNVRAGLRMERI